MSIAEITQSKAYKNFMGKLYGWGAAVVIVGALFKIQHWPGAGPMLILGLGTEAVIFFFSAFEPPHEDVDWSLVYPELAGMHDEDGEKKEDKGSLTEQLDTMLEEAKIGPELIQSLGTGLQSLSDNASKMSQLSDATVATNQYVDSIKNASRKVEDLSNSYAQASSSFSSSANDLSGAYSKATGAMDSSVNALSSAYEKATGALNSLSNTTSEAKSYNDQLVQVTKNLSSLNASYELQLQGSNEHVKATKKLYDGIQELMKNLSESVEDTRKYKSEISNLAENLGQLNTIYGNMLSAMSVKR